jgi:alkylation response protein AidB-like acyl-CoA dehydrogenase
MRGTGSHDELVADVEVPRERTGTLWSQMWPDDPIFRLRSFDVLGPSLGAVPLGLGRAALDVVEAKARAEWEHPPPPGPRTRFADDPLAQRELALAEARLRGARALLLDAVDAAHAHALRGDTPPRAATALVGLACHEALAAATVAVETSCRLSGSGAIRVGQPLDRIRRDLNTAGTHVMFSPPLTAAFARQLAGIDTVVFPFLPTLDG